MKQNGARFSLWLFIKRCVFWLIVAGVFGNLAVFYYFAINASMENERARRGRDNKIDSVLEKLAEDKGCEQ